jgi:hypothetical protein
VLLILSLSLVAESAALPFLAGAILALTLEKPSLFLLLPAVVAVQKRYQMLLGLSHVCMRSRDCLSLDCRFLQHQRLHQSGGALYGDARKNADRTGHRRKSSHVDALALVDGIGRCRHPLEGADGSFTEAFCIGIAGSLFVSPLSNAHDCGMLVLPVLHYLFSGSRLQRLTAALWLVPVAPLAFVLSPPRSIYTALLVRYCCVPRL